MTSKSEARRVAVQREADPIARLRAMLGAATPGPWRAHNFRSYAHESWSVVADGDEPPVCDDACSEPDARAIAALRTLAPELLAVVEAVLLDHDQSIGPEEQAEGVKPWWKLPATKHALDALRARAAEVTR